MNNKEIHIALAADSNYLIPVTVVLQSLFEHNRGKIFIYLLHLKAKMQDVHLQAISDFVSSKGGEFIPLEVKDELINKFPDTRHGKSALLRLCLPTLLPQVDKILYLDGDVIVRDSLSELFQTDLSTCYIAAAKDSTSAYSLQYQELLGIDKTHGYFNSGVTLLNLHLLRQINLSEELHKFVHKYNEQIHAPDQDALNYICQNGKTCYIHPRYNMNYAVEKDIARQVWGKQAIKEAKQRPAIIHFIGPVKPWSVLSVHPQRKLWWKYLKQTPFADFRPKDATFRNRVRKGYLVLVSPIERLLSLETKKKIGKLIPSGVKKSIKKSLHKNT